MDKSDDKVRLGWKSLLCDRRVLCVLTMIFSALAALIIYSFFLRSFCAQYDYVNHDFICNRHAISKSPYVRLEDEVGKYFDSEKKAGDIHTAAMYFRDLRYGPIFGIDENEKFIPASLLKLPLVMTYFSIGEEYPDIFDQKITYSSEALKQFPPLNQNQKPDQTLVNGDVYTVKELLRRTVVYSDNASYYTLAVHLQTIPDGTTHLLRTFQEIGVMNPRTNEQEAISPRNYSTIFRQLYNISYLTPAYSNELLGWLVDSTFTRGLRAGVPQEVKVANKFGERILPDGSKQLHDCGIIYYPNNPYVLCVMTKGADWKKMEDVISKVSEIVYEEVKAREL